MPTSDIGRWLESHGLGKHADVFTANELELGDLLELTEGDIDQLGLPLGPRRRLQKAIRALHEEHLGERGGSAPRPAGASGAERRQLTVMFCDMVGSTALSERMDPEDYREVIAAFQSAVRTSIGFYGGYIARYMGDGVLAYFGYPQAHEDDAERAARAGLDIVGAVGRIPGPGGERLQVRIGIATGQVVVGDVVGEGASQERAALGETPNVAARLQALAQPDWIVIGASTERLVAGRFELEALGPQRLKGIEAAVPAFRVAGAIATESRFLGRSRGQGGAFIGRDDEQSRLLGRWRRAARGELQLVHVAGEPGIGKSRLVQALREGLTGVRHVPLLYQCSPYFVSSSFRPFIEQMRRGARLGAGDSPARQLERLEALLHRSQGYEAQDVTLFGLLLGIPCEVPASLSDPDDRRRRTVRALVRQLRGLALECPVLCVLEDIHWADPSTLEVLDCVVQELADAAVMMVLTYRPEFESPWVGRPQTTLLALSRLSRRETREMVAALASGVELPSTLVSRMVERADGIPLFVEELTRGALERGGEAGGEQVVPESLQDLLMERLDRLGPAKAIAQAAAVLGREFTRPHLDALCGVPASALDAGLDALVGAGLVFVPAGSTRDRFVFKHALIQDAARASLLRARRTELHGRAADLLAGQAAPAEVVAFHLEAAGRREAALARWHEAASQASQQGAHEEALAHLGKGLAVCGAVAARADRERIECDLHLDRAASLRVLDRLDDAFDALRAAEELALGQSDHARLSRVCYLRGNLSFPLGRYEQCLAEHARARDAARAAGSVELEVQALGGLGDAHYLRGRMRTAHGTFRQCVELARSGGLLDVVANNLGMIGATYGYALLFQDAIAAAEQGAAMAEPRSLPRAVVVAKEVAGYFLVEIGELRRAEALLREALATAEAIQARRFEPIALLYLAKIHLACRDLAAARDAASAAWRISRETGAAFTGPWTLGAVMRVAGTAVERRDACEAALRLLDQGCVSHNHLQFHRDAMEVWLEAGEPQAALSHAAMLEAYAAPEPLPWSDFFVRRTRALVRALEGDRSEPAQAEIRSLIGIARAARMAPALLAMERALEPPDA